MSAAVPSPRLVAPPRTRAWDEEAAPLWQAWRRQRDAATRTRLAEHYASFARMLAARCFRQRFSQELEFADYEQFALVGLLESIERFDADRGSNFEAYASRRITGAVLDGAESLSEKQRQISTRLQARRDRARSLAEGGEAREEGAGDALQRLADIAIGLAIGFMLDDSVMYLEGDPVDPGPTPYGRLEIAQLRARLATLVSRLPPAEERVIRHHYYQHQPFDEIARAGGLTKGRIAQIHHAALARLRRWSAEDDGVVIVT
jgi:RNA polymerase sigma factor for flagellar operon FliA